MFIDPFIFVSAVLIMIIGSNFDAPFSKNRFIIYGVAICMLAASFTIEYQKHNAELEHQRNLAAIAKIEQEAEAKRQAKELAKQAAELKKQQDEAAKQAAIKAEQERLQNIAKAAELKKQAELAAKQAAIKAERERQENIAKAAEQQRQREIAKAKQAEKQKQQELRLAEQKRLREQQRLEQSKRDEVVQRRARSLANYASKIPANRGIAFDLIKECLYYESQQNGLSKYLSVQVGNNPGKLEIHNTYQRNMNVNFIFFDDLERDCETSLRELVDAGVVSKTYLQQNDLGRVIYVNQINYNTNNSQKVKPKDVMKDILGGVLNNILKKN